jgi:3D (Asp-Asp-Asp) domain-containing protein
MATGSIAEVIRYVYEVSTVDKGTKKLLDSERAVQRETKQTTRAMAGQDAAVKRSASVAEQAARREESAAKRAGAARRREEGLLKRGTRGIGGAPRRAAGAVANLAPVGGIAGAAYLGAGAIKGASAEAESISKNRQLFGKFAIDIEKFSQRSATSFAISRQAALEYTGVFGNLARAQQLGQKESAGLSVRLTKLAADLASFNNTSIEEALDALRSGLTGETEPLRKFGVVLSAVAVQAEAMRSGIVKVNKTSADYQTRAVAVEKAQLALSKAMRATGPDSLKTQDAQAKLSQANEQLTKSTAGGNVELTAQQKILATNNLVFRQTKIQQGDVGRTMGGLANQQKQLTAQFTDARNELGTQLLPVMTHGAIAANKFIQGMRDGTGAGGKFARSAKELAHDLQPVGEALKDVGGFLVEHPRLVVAAAGAYGAFKAVRGTVKIAHDIADISSSIAAVGRRASKTKLAVLLANGAKGAGGKVRAALGTVTTVVSDVMGTAASRGAEALGAKGRWSKAGNRAGRAFGAAAVLGLGAAAPEINKQITKLLGGSKDTPTGFGSFLWNRITGGKIPGGRRGGVVGEFAGGGLVPIMAAGGEMHVDGGVATMIPGDPRSDSTLMFARPDSAIITADGQARMSMGASLSQALASQAPHFVKGGRVSGRFMSTSYGPPWGGIQGGGTTATGVNLRRSPHVYGVAVDPSVIPLGTQVYATPNPFGRSGPFRAFDTGDAIKGNRLDFYDWRGRKKQNAWGRKMVRVSSARLSGDTPQAPADEDVTARIPLSLSPSKVRAGLVQDAVEQGIAAGAAGLKRKEMARAVAGGRGARRNPIMEAIAGALTPTTREVTLPGQSSDSSSGGGPSGPLPGGVTVPSAAWNPAKRPIAKWIVPYLSWAASASRGSSSSTGPARRGGGGRWSGTVTSGFRSRAEQTRIWNSGVRPAARPGSLNHEGSTYPRGAVDVTQASMLAQVLRGKPGPHLLQFAGAKDPVHFSHPHGGSYRGGGRVRRMARGGVIGGKLGAALAAATSFKGGSFDALDAAIGGAVGARLEILRRAIVAQVRKGGDKKTVQRLRGIIDLVDFELGRRIGRYQDVVEQRTMALDRATAASERVLRVAGVDPGSAVGIAVSSRGQAAESKVRAANIASLTKALAIARRTGNQEVIRDAVDKLAEARDALAESLVRQVELWRDQLKALADERTAQAGFVTGLAGAGGSILEAWQRTTGVQDTAGGMAQRAAYTAGVTLPALEGQRQAALFAAQIAAATGDVNGWRAAVQDAAGAAADIASAQADAADLIRAAAMKAAQDVVDVATHGRTMADLGLQRLDLEQQLIGTHDTTGGAMGRADFIRAQIIPAIQGEISALVVQLAAAQVTGDKALATQIGEAIYAKQNDVLEQQLAAQNAIKENTDMLKEFGGSQAFSYQSQTFTDLDAIRARVGA